MIKGMGIDITEIARIKKAIGSFNESFVKRVFTEKEQQIASARKDFVTFYAGRWAAKEAVSKALGCGIGEKCSFTEIEILNDDFGKPQAFLSGNAAETFKSLNAEFLHITISHEGKNAIAMAIIE
ncbi:MAG: holo-ACP synthase [Lentisphaeria bacterium]|nr:holo-ACP synthase [Lentisphaeria bacterium]MBR7127078.1 holo-ACP synthase [Lentisphaeria bacterium]